MLIRRVLVEATISDDECFFANSEHTIDLGGEPTYLVIREQFFDDSAILVILDNTLLDDEEKQKWLKNNLHKKVWLRVTGNLELHSYVAGTYERISGEVHRPAIRQVLNLIAVEIISNFELEMATRANP